jgi:hypothetical protein
MKKPTPCVGFPGSAVNGGGVSSWRKIVANDVRRLRKGSWKFEEAIAELSARSGLSGLVLEFSTPSSRQGGVLALLRPFQSQA